MEVLQRLFGHNLWATRLLAERCAALPEPQHELEAGGTRGSLATTLNHILGAEHRYLFRLGHPLEDPVTEKEPRPLAALPAEVDRLGAAWARYLAGGDPERRVETTFGDRPAFIVDWVLVAQAIHHGQDHRTHLTTVLAANGLEAPQPDGWQYGISLEQGRAPEPSEKALAAVEVDHGRANRFVARALGHSMWANRELLRHCVELGEEARGWTAPGTYGNLWQTLTHLITVDRSYWCTLSGAPRIQPAEEEPAERLLEILDELDRGWPEVLAADEDPERIVRTRSGREYHAWVVLTQVLSHASEHRANIGTIIGARGTEPPDLDVWAYGERENAVGEL